MSDVLEIDLHYIGNSRCIDPWIVLEVIDHYLPLYIREKPRVCFELYLVTPFLVDWVNVIVLDWWSSEPFVLLGVTLFNFERKKGQVQIYRSVTRYHDSSDQW